MLVYFLFLLSYCVFDNLKKNKKIVSLLSMLVVVLTKIKPKKISRSSFACCGLSHVNSFNSFLFFGDQEEKTMMKMLSGSYMHYCWFNQEPYYLVFSHVLNACRFQLSPMHVLIIIIIHTIRSCKWKAIMTIYDELTEIRKAGMNLTSLVFVNMISSSFLIQPIMNETCLQWQLEIIVAYAMLN